MENFIPKMAARPSAIDKRDHQDTKLAMATPYPATYKVDWKDIPVRMQYRIGKCVAESVARYIEKLYYQKSGVYVGLSDDFLYLITKKYIDGDMTEGTSFRSVLKAAQKYGICRASVFSISIDESTKYEDYIQWVNKIPSEAITDALNYKIGQYIGIPVDIDLLKAAIWKYDGLVARFDVGSEWWTAKDGRSSWNHADLNPLRSPATVISGHGVGLDGYNTLVCLPKNQGEIANSWSKGWGNYGYENFIFEDYLPHLTEAWAITLNPIPVSNLVSFQMFQRLIDFLKSTGSWKPTN